MGERKTHVYKSNRELSIFTKLLAFLLYAVCHRCNCLPHTKSRANEYLKYKISNVESFMIRAAVKLIRYNFTTILIETCKFELTCQNIIKYFLCHVEITVNLYKMKTGKMLPLLLCVSCCVNHVFRNQSELCSLEISMS